MGRVFTPVTALARASLFWFKQSLLRTGYFLLAGSSLVVLVITGHYGGKVTHARHPHENVLSGQNTVAPVAPETKEEADDD